LADNLRTLRHKRETVGEIQQITRAMKLVSAAKLRRALVWQEAVADYATQVTDALALVLTHVGADFTHPLLIERPVERIGLVLVAGDKGLCGAFNANIVAAARDFVSGQRARVQTVTVGARTTEMARRAQLHVVREFAALQERRRGADVQEIGRHLLSAWHAGEFDAIHLCYARFRSRVNYEPTVERILPAPLPERSAAPQSTLLEPNAPRLAEVLLPQYVLARLFAGLVSTAASEHSARLMAMTAATDNAQEMLQQLSRQINRARQAEVTRQLLDVVSGADALQSQG
jgi:F-type H+-transporting ATPase subunit gamma